MFFLAPAESLLSSDIISRGNAFEKWLYFRHDVSSLLFFVNVHIRISGSIARKKRIVANYDRIARQFTRKFKRLANHLDCTALRRFTRSFWFWAVRLERIDNADLQWLTSSFSGIILFVISTLLLKNVFQINFPIPQCVFTYLNFNVIYHENRILLVLLLLNVLSNERQIHKTRRLLLYFTNIRTITCETHQLITMASAASLPAEARSCVRIDRKNSANYNRAAC